MTDKDALLARLNLTLVPAISLAERLTERVRELEAALEAVTRERDALKEEYEPVWLTIEALIAAGDAMAETLAFGYPDKDAVRMAWRALTRGEGSDA